MPEDAIFQSAPSLNEEYAERWSFLFLRLISLLKDFFDADSPSHLLQILHSKMPQTERPPMWTESHKYVLQVFLKRGYDSTNVGVEEVKFCPPNSLMVLADDYYFRKIIDIFSPEIRRAICDIE